MLLLLFTHECKCTPETAATKKKKHNKFSDRILPSECTLHCLFCIWHGNAYRHKGTNKAHRKRRRIGGKNVSIENRERKTITQKKCNKKIMRVMFWCKCRWWWKKNLAISMIVLCVCVWVCKFQMKYVHRLSESQTKSYHLKLKNTIWNNKKNQLHKRTHLCTIKIVLRISSIAISISIQFVRVCLTCRCSAMHV